MTGSFGILLFVLFIGASNLALGYAAAVYFGKARLEIVLLTFTCQLPSLNPLAWFLPAPPPEEEYEPFPDDLPYSEPEPDPEPTPVRTRAAKSAPRPAPVPPPELTEEPAPPYEPEAEPEREPAPVPSAKPAGKPAAAPIPLAAETELEPPDDAAAFAEAEASSPVEAAEPFDLEASLSAYSAAVQKTPRPDEPLKSEPSDEPPASEPAEDFGRVERGPGAGEAESWADPPVEEVHAEEALGPDPLSAPTTEHGLATLLDDLVAQNLSGLEDAFARIDRDSPAEETSDAGGAKREAVGVH